MIQVELNKKSNSNPFYGLKYCLNLQTNSTASITEEMLNKAWNEVKKDKQKREMFFSLLFSIGDITNRQHNIFHNKSVDSGGTANRKAFEVIFNWMLETNIDQFKKFLFAHLFNEYQCFDTLFKCRVKTKPNTNQVISAYSVFSNEKYCEILLEYVYQVINGKNPFDKMLVAKFLTIPRTSKRSGHKQLLPVTRVIMYDKLNFIKKLSEMMHWDTEYLKGYREWRKQYNGDLESVLFSTGKIKEFDQTEFTEWLNKMPAKARQRVRVRILKNQSKWANLYNWFTQWETSKLKAQEEQRRLEEKIRQGQANEEDKLALAKVKKDAKVTIGATSFNELYDEILDNRVDQLKLESFINKVNLPYNTLVLIDDSGSMTGAPFNFAAFLASVCLVKNPDDGRNLLGMFSSTGRFYSYIDVEACDTPNSIMRRKIGKTIHKPFVDPLLSFYENYQNINKFCHASFEGNWTDITTILSTIEKGAKHTPELLDLLKNYPVWTIVSDGELNSMITPEASFSDFLRKCENILGFKPFLICIDIKRNSSCLRADRFAGIDNLIYIPSNIAMIEQFLTNFKDMDVYDVYTPLQSIYRSNRYELVRANTL